MASTVSSNTLNNALNVLLTSSRSNAQVRKSRGREDAGVHDIDMTFMRKLWEDQKGLCYYSSIPLNYEKYAWKVSIERTDPSKGYVSDNTVLCCCEFNGRMQWSFDKIKEMLDILDKNIEVNLVSFENEKKEKKSYTKLVETVVDGVSHFNCTHCGEVKPTSEFYKDKHLGCKTCLKEIGAIRRSNKSP